jgi:hypothetical protein
MCKCGCVSVCDCGCYITFSRSIDVAGKITNAVSISYINDTYFPYSALEYLRIYRLNYTVLRLIQETVSTYSGTIRYPPQARLK